MTKHFSEYHKNLTRFLEIYQVQFFGANIQFCNSCCNSVFREFFLETFSLKHYKSFLEGLYPAGIYLVKVNNGNTRTVCKICPIINFISYSSYCSGISIVNFEQVNAGYVEDQYLNLQIHFKSFLISDLFRCQHKLKNPLSLLNGWNWKWNLLIANDLHSNNCITKQWFKYFGRNLLVGISGVTDKVKEIK